MNKIPNCCAECYESKFFGVKEPMCKKTGKKFDERHNPSKNKAEWCPLKEDRLNSA